MKIKQVIFAALGCALFACQNQPSETTTVNSSEAPEESGDTIDMGMHPDWTLHSSIYEVNIRQHTQEGTLNAMRKKLPELQKLGVKILWLMPVQPIGLENRKGELGSPYSIKDFTAINPDFGTMDDFKDFVNAAHDLGFKIILDWVANHTAWDAVWMKDHKDWYTQRNGQVVAPSEDWTDVADLNYDNPEMRKSMLEAMMFWIDSANIDGFRCDMAKMVPLDFWIDTRKKLDSIKPVFMLGEAENPEFHKAFDMTYGWELHHMMKDIAQGRKSVSAIDTYMAKVDSVFPETAFRMYFTTNHDENSWQGTVQERLGNYAKNFFLLSTTLPQAMPLVYSGQAYGLDKSLAFFRKDTMSGTDTSLFDWYSQVVDLKMNHPTLMMEPYAGSYERIGDRNNEKLFAFKRIKGEEELLVVLNFSEDAQMFNAAQGDDWEAVIEGEEIQKNQNGEFSIPANGYVLAKR